MRWLKNTRRSISRKKGREIFPDEIFLDSHNISEFDTYQFEGRFERPVNSLGIKLIAIVFVLGGLFFLFRAWGLQVVLGEEYGERGENNRLRHVEIFAERGVIYDRNNVELAWNESTSDFEFSLRQFIEKPGMAHLLGHVSYPHKDSSGFYFRTTVEGKDGVELFYNDRLSGINGVRVIEINAVGEIQSANVYSPTQDGSSINLTIDAEVQNKFFSIIKNVAESVGFWGGAGILMDVKNGDVLSLVSYPEFDSFLLTNATNTDEIAIYQADQRAPFLNRAVQGLYTPGSIVKPFVGLAALEEGVVNESKVFVSLGELEVPNPYDPENPSIFRDWKPHGAVDLKRAIAVSSNIYFYIVGGGHGDTQGLGIDKLERYMKLFGFGAETGINIPGEKGGVIPTPAWKKENFGEDWRLGDTYNTVIGQYGFQITPIQAARAVAAIANSGRLVTPNVIMRVDGDKSVVSTDTVEKIEVSFENLEIIRQGMRLAVEEGTAQGLYFPSLKVAAKTGTAEVGKLYTNAWAIGFFPYDNPRFAFVVLMDRGPRDNLTGGVYIMRQMIEWIIENKPEYIK